jgi:hypothetical protein
MRKKQPIAVAIHPKLAALLHLAALGDGSKFVPLIDVSRDCCRRGAAVSANLA